MVTLLRGYISGTETPTDKRSSLVGTPIPSTVYGINAESCQYLLWHVARAARMLSQIFHLLFLGNDCAEIFVCTWGPISYSLCSSHGSGISARAHVQRYPQTALLYLRNGLADRIQFWCVS